MQTTLYDLVSGICKEKKMLLFQPTPYIDYVPPKMSTGKVWFVYYYCKNPGTGKMKRFRIRIEHISSSKREKTKAAQQIIAAIQSKLALGWTPFYTETAPGGYIKVFEGFDAFLKAKAKESEKQSIDCYRSYINVFGRWLRKHGFGDDSPLSSLTKEFARGFLDHLDESPDISPRTYNNYLAFLCTLYEWFMDKGYAPVNLFKEFKRKPRRAFKKKRRLFTDQELHALFSWLSANNPEYLAVTLLCYCCFIRPKEISLLKCGDINLTEQTVHVRGEIAKNDKDSWRTIPDSIMPALCKLNLSNPEWYLFGKHQGDGEDFRPGPEPMFIRKISAYWDGYVRPACKFPLELQFYSLKDTGITNMLGGGVPINIVQQQADHSSVAMTAIYVGKSASVSKVIREADIPTI